MLSAPVPWFALTTAGAEAFAIRARQTDVFTSPAALRTRVAVRTLPRLGPPIGTDGTTLQSRGGALRYDPATGVPTVRSRLENVRASPFALHGHDGRIYGLFDVDMWSTYGQRIAVHDDASGTMLYNVAFEPGFLLPGVGELSLAGLW